MPAECCKLEMLTVLAMVSNTTHQCPIVSPAGQNTSTGQACENTPGFKTVASRNLMMKMKMLMKVMVMVMMKMRMKMKMEMDMKMKKIMKMLMMMMMTMVVVMAMTMTVMLLMMISCERRVDE